MGSLNIFDIATLKNQYNLDIFIETGTGLGGSLVYALEVTKEYPFSEYYSIEISTSIYERCLHIPKEYPSHHIRLLNESSVIGLEIILKDLNPEKNILFWLDAHFPNVDYNFASYTETKNKLSRIPLEEEIRLIKQYRSKSKDYFIIDDLRIYEDGNYESGNWTDRNLYGGNGIQFIYDAFEDSHTITKLNNDEGYVILTPK